MTWQERVTDVALGIVLAFLLPTALLAALITGVLWGLDIAGVFPLAYPLWRTFLIAWLLLFGMWPILGLLIFGGLNDLFKWLDRRFPNQ